MVTGAGSGIGRATALALAEAGMRVAVTDLDIDSARAVTGRIEEQGGTAIACALDVRDEGHVQRAAAHIGDSLGNAAVLVNNAGIGVGGYFLDTAHESWQEIITVNLLGVVHGCRSFLPGMVASGQGGHVVNVASMLGYVGIRGATAYTATKFGVLGLSESLRAELADDGIGVSTICPGLVRTNIISSAILEAPGLDTEGRRADIQALYERRNYPPERVAAAIVRAIRRTRAVVPVAPEAWATYYLKRWAPGLMRWITRRGLAGLDAKL